MRKAVLLALTLGLCVAGCDTPPQRPHAGPPTGDEAAPGSVERPTDAEPSPPRPDRPDTPVEFIAGEITVVTLEPGSAGGERYLRHRYGEARRVPVTIAGTRMLRIAATPHDAIAWSEDGLVFTFERGQEQTHEWLERVAAATVRVRVPAAAQSALAGAGVTRYASNDLAVLRSPQEMAHVALGEFLAALAL